MRRPQLIILWLAALLTLYACGTPSEEVIQTAVAKALASQISPTTASQPTAALPSEDAAPEEAASQPSPTSPVIATDAPPPTPIPTPDPDFLIFTGQPSNLMCEKVDLPLQGNYTLFGDISDPLQGQSTNQGIVDVHPNPQKVLRYVEETERILGWTKMYVLAQEEVSVPQRIRCQTTTFGTTAGARHSLRWPLWDDELNYRIMEPEQFFGQDTTLKFRRIELDDGTVEGTYRVEFTYQNLVGMVQTYEPVDIASPAFAYQVAARLIARYEASELIYTIPLP